MQTLFGWRSVFAFLVLATAALWLACWKLLPETLPPEKRQSLRPAYLGSTYWKVMTSPAFLTACAALHRLAALCEEEACSRAEQYRAARLLWPRLGACLGVLTAILLW